MHHKQHVPFCHSGCRCSCVEQSGHSDARRLHRWLEHGSKAHLQCVLSCSFAGAARQAHAKAASTSSRMNGKAASPDRLRAALTPSLTRKLCELYVQDYVCFGYP